MTRWWNFEFQEAEFSNKEITIRKINQIFKVVLDFKNHISKFKTLETCDLMMEVLLSNRLPYRFQLQKILQELNLLILLDKESFKIVSKVLNIPEDKAKELLQGGKQKFKFYILKDSRFEIYLDNINRNLDIIVIDGDNKDGQPISILKTKPNIDTLEFDNLLAQTIHNIGTIQKNTSNRKIDYYTSKLYSSVDSVKQISGKLENRYISLNDSYNVNSYYEDNGNIHVTTIYTTTKNYEFEVNVMKRGKGFKNFSALNNAMYLHNLKVGFESLESRLINIRRDLVF